MFKKCKECKKLVNIDDIDIHTGICIYCKAQKTYDYFTTGKK